MSEFAIRAHGLGKKYYIGHQNGRDRYASFRDVMSRAGRQLLRSAADVARGRQSVVGDEVEEFWALREVDFSVRPGEVVGVIGRNGAGKSTMLKVLSRITEPSAGSVEINGRMASLLEVGTGFHPELTGRENIFLNGAVLGMRRAEIKRKFDEIVAFSEVERFLDTPVKRYSSGMYVRLAFAVAAHLEPEILVIDEVLAVGDSQFQKKCLGKMRNVAGEGRTVLFVSHNMGAVQALCDRAICLSGGSVVFDGDVGEGISVYAERSGQAERVFRRTAGARRLSHTHLVGAEVGDIVPSANGGHRLPLRLTVRSDKKRPIKINLYLQDARTVPLAIWTTGDVPLVRVETVEGEKTFELSLDVSSLMVGTYSMSIDLVRPLGESLDRNDEIVGFDIEELHWKNVPSPPQQEWGYGSFWQRLTVEDEWVGEPARPLAVAVSNPDQLAPVSQES